MYKFKLKTTWEEEKFLKMSNFSFSHSNFYAFGDLSVIFIILKIIFCLLSVWKNLKFFIWERVNPFPNNKILDSSKLKEFADDNFKFDENGTKFSEWLENTVGKSEIAHYEQFLLFPQYFQKSCTADT